MSDILYIGLKARQLEDSPAYQPISCVKLTIGGEDENGNPIVCTAGNPKSGRTIETSNPLIWDASIGNTVAQNILAAVQGYAYKPFTADGAIINPAVEIGDAVEVGDVYSVIADVETSFTPLMSANISAPVGSDIDHEYPYESSESYAQRRTAAELGQLKTEFIVQNGEVSWAISQIGSKDQEGSIWNKLTSVQTTVDGITVKTESDVKTIIGTTEIKWSKVDVTPEQIKTEVEEYFDASGAADTAAAAALRAAKKYTDDEIEPISGQYTSKIEQTAREIQATVAAQESKWDLSGLPSGVTISVYGYGTPKNNKISAADYSGKYYLDQTAGRWYYSDGTTWSRQSGSLKLITTNLSTRITTTASGLESVVEEIGTKDADGTILNRLSKIEQTSSDITLSVYSDRNGTTYFKLSDGSGEISSTSFDFKTDIVNVAGNLSANKIAANVSIDTPYIYGGSINGATITSAYFLGGFFADPIGNVGITIGYSGYDVGSLELRKINNTETYFQVFWNMYGVYLSLGGYTVGRMDSGTFYPAGVWDFRNATKVIMPDGTVFQHS